MGWARQNQWIVLAVASGACAAFNGVFAKLYVLSRRCAAVVSLSLSRPFAARCFGRRPDSLSNDGRARRIASLTIASNQVTDFPIELPPT